MAASSCRVEVPLAWAGAGGSHAVARASARTADRRNVMRRLPLAWLPARLGFTRLPGKGHAAAPVRVHHGATGMLGAYVTEAAWPAISTCSCWAPVPAD